MFGRKKPESIGSPALTKDERKALSEDDIKAFRELEDLTPLLLASLDDKIKSGRIGTVIGIDASGRIPALLMRDTIKQLQQKAGFSAPDMHFFRGRISSAEIPALRKAIQDKKLDKDRIVLIVDDTHNTGTSIDPIRTALLEEGYMVEVAVFFATEPAQFKKAYPSSHYGAATEILGQDADGSNRRYKSPKIYMKRMLAGTIRRPTSDSLFASLIHRHGKHVESRPSVTAARKLLKETAEKVVKRYEHILERGE